MSELAMRVGHDLEAANAYREVIKLRPDISEAFGGLGTILARRLHTAGVRQGKMTACRCEDRVLPAMTSWSLIGLRRGMPAMAHGHRVLNAMLVAEK
jgi:hypothetical protein